MPVALTLASSTPQPKLAEHPANLLVSDIILPPPNIKSAPDSGDNISTKQPSPTAASAQLARPASTNLGQVSQQQTARQIYQQLQTDQAINIQIALPTDTNKHNQLLDYLYRCSATQFAVLQQTPEAQQLRYLSPKRYVTPSQWLRVVSGALSPQEQSWLADTPGQAVRIDRKSVV